MVANQSAVSDTSVDTLWGMVRGTLSGDGGNDVLFGAPMTSASGGDGTDTLFGVVPTDLASAAAIQTLFGAAHSGQTAATQTLFGGFRIALDGGTPGVVQATRESPVRPECLVPEFRALAEPFPLGKGEAKLGDNRLTVYALGKTPAR